MTKDLSKIPKLHWSLKYGSPFAKRIEKAMLLPEGVNDVVRCKNRNASRSNEPAFFRVHYDSAYVEEKIIKEIFEPLECRQWETMERVLKDAWGTWALRRGSLDEKI